MKASQLLTGNFFLPLIAISSASFAQQTFSGSAAAQLIPQAEKITMSTVAKAPAFISVDKSKSIPSSNYNEWIRSALKMRSEDGLQYSKTVSDETGLTHKKYQQLYNGIPVEGGEYISHEKNNSIVSTNGTYYPDIKANPNPSLSEDAALKSALKYMNAQQYFWQNQAAVTHDRKVFNKPALDYYPHGTLVIAPLNGDYKLADFRLCWKFDVYAIAPLKREYVFVDAHSGEIIFHWSIMQTADVVGTANTLYSGTKTMTSNNNAGTYTLNQAAPVNIHTQNLQNGTATSSAVDFTNSSSAWTQGAPDQCATDAHWGLEGVYDFYKNLLNRNSIDDAGMPIMGYIHYQSNYDNAMWTGSEMVFGDGDGSSFTYFEGLDVMGHEVSHGVTQHTCALQYSGEPGALNEGFSDCMGNAIEIHWRPSAHSWIMGEDITPNHLGIRDMSNPKADQQPDTYNGTYWSLSDPHIGSGVLNYWFYLVAMGGSGTNDNNNSYSVTGIGITKAQAILYNAWKSYMTSTSNHANTRTATEQACQALYPSDCAAYAAVQEAWYAVGVGGAPTNPVLSVNFAGTPNVSCTAPVTVNFTDKSSGATTWSWDFGDGSPKSTTQNPSHTYNNTGNYTVKLVCTQTGGCGSGIDSTIQTNYISVGVTGATLPLSESFESSASVPSGWSVVDPNTDGFKWVVSSSVSGFGNGTKCMAFDNCSPSTDITGRKDKFITKAYSFSNALSASMTFDVASTYLILNSKTYADSLAVFYSSDCGTTWNQIYYKGGATLATAPNLTTASPTCFIPTATQWRTETINLNSLIGQGAVMFAFENRSGWAEWMYIDNINITSVTGAGVADLNSQNAFSIYPNPTSGEFTVQSSGFNMKSVELYNVMGEKVLSETLNSQLTTLNLSGASGMYFIKVSDGTSSFTKKLNKQ